MTPTYLLRDPELYKQITIKDFDHFVDHKFIIDPEADTLMGNTVFLMKGQKWRDMRSTLSPAFTGSKMRHMFGFVRECAEATCNFYQKALRSDGDNVTNMRELFTRYANDVIASCAFGLKINSLEDRNNEFYLTGNKFMELASVRYFIKLVLQRIMPSVLRAFGIEFLDEDIKKFFSNMVLNNMAERKLKGIVRKDMIDILIQTKEGRLRETGEDSQTRINLNNSDSDPVTPKQRNWTDAELISQCFVFFLAGFDSTTSVLVSTIYELILNEHVQEKLADEIIACEKELNGRQIEYDDLVKLKYLDMVVSEVVRIHPPAPFLDRVCTKDYVLSDGKDLNLKIEKGMNIWAPVYTFHLNPNYFDNPYHFDPERFSDENKHKINPAHYLPFGSGPRICIGSRFALMEIKGLLYFLLKSFKLQVCHKTQVPMKLISAPFGMYPEKGLHVNLNKR